MAQPKILLRELRAEFLTASVLPVILAGALVRQETGTWNPSLFFLTLAGVICLHLGANTANDYFDHLSGNDASNREYIRPFTGGSRLIQNKLISPAIVLTMSLAFFCAALAVCFFLYRERGPVVIILGLIGLLLGYFYTAPPLRFAHRGLGELAVGLSYWLIGIGTYFVQTASFSLQVFVATLPLALMTAAIIIINEFPDSKADALVGKKTLVVRWGRKRSIFLFQAVIISGYLPILAGTIGRLMPPLTLIGLLSLPLAAKAIATLRTRYDRPEQLAPASASTIICHLVTALLLTAAYLIS
ncbi:MAG: prenyltransferase [Candidatus Krumholzibacteriota bacterium]|nr:prenyltransferase [Candidatus Krumholzibacteriota bacterium]